MSYTKKPSVVKIDPTVTQLQPDQFDNDDPIQGYPFGTSAMRVTTATGFPETSGDVITSRTTDDTGSQIFIGEKAYIRAFEGNVWSSWRELGESGGGPVEWDDILNKPSQFPPSPHTHDIEDITGLQAALNDKASAQSVNELRQEVDEHKAETTQNAHLAKNIGIEDTAGNFTATDVEGALSELFTSVSDGKDLIGGAITDVDPSIVIPPNPTFQDLANAIRQISQGMNYAAGTIASATLQNNVEYAVSLNLDFEPVQAVVLLPGLIAFGNGNIIRNPVLAKGDYIDNSSVSDGLRAGNQISPTYYIYLQITEFSSNVLKFKYYTGGAASLPQQTVNNLSWLLIG